MTDPQIFACLVIPFLFVLTFFACLVIPFLFVLTCCGMLPLCPDMAAHSVGSNNFPTKIYENLPDPVDCLAAEMLKYDVKPETESSLVERINHVVIAQ